MRRMEVSASDQASNDLMPSPLEEWGLLNDFRDKHSYMTQEQRGWEGTNKMTSVCELHFASIHACLNV